MLGDLTVGAVSISCLLCTKIYNAAYEQLQKNIFFTCSRHRWNYMYYIIFQLHFEPVSLLLESQRSEKSSKADNPTSILLSTELDIISQDCQTCINQA